MQLNQIGFEFPEDEEYFRKYLCEVGENLNKYEAFLIFGL